MKERSPAKEGKGGERVSRAKTSGCPGSESTATGGTKRETRRWWWVVWASATMSCGSKHVGGATRGRVSQHTLHFATAMMRAQARNKRLDNIG